MKFILFIFFFLAFSAVAYSQEFNASLTPSLIPLKLDTNNSAQLTLTNNSEDTKNFRVSLKEVEPNPSWDGTLNFVSTDDISLSSPTLARSITITPGTNLTLNPGQSQSISISITNTSSLVQKDYYLAAVVTDSTLQDKDTIKGSIIESSISSILLISLNNKLADLEIDNFSSPFFALSNNVEFEALVSNNSDSFGEFNSSLTIQNIFGRQIADVTIPQHFILSGSKRYISANNSTKILWQRPFLFGIYKAVVKINYQDKTNQKDLYFTSFSPILLFSAIVVFSFLIGVYLRVKRRILV